MVRATVRSWSCFSQLYRASPSLAAKNIINLILVLTIWWCPCVESSLVLLEKSVCYDQHVLLTKLCEPFSCFILYSKAKLACYSRYLLTFYFCIPEPYDEKDFFFGVSSRSIAGHHRTIQLQLLRHSLRLLWYWMVSLKNEQSSLSFFWDCTQVLRFGLFFWLWWLLHFF